MATKKQAKQASLAPLLLAVIGILMIFGGAVYYFKAPSETPTEIVEEETNVVDGTDTPDTADPPSIPDTDTPISTPN